MSRFNHIIISDLPLGQLPILKVDGEDFCQSIAIARYAASQCDDMPKLDAKQELRSNMLIDTLNECFEGMVKPAFQKCSTGPEEGNFLPKTRFLKKKDMQYYICLKFI